MSARPASETLPVVHLDVPAEHRYLNVVSACLAALLEQIDIPARDIVTYNIQLAVQEACTNIVDHAYKGRAGERIAVEIFLGDAPPRMTIDLYDDGEPFNAAQMSEPALDEPHVHGYGLFLMQQLTDSVQYERVENRNHWQLSKNL